ncbi:MAG: hypothetical protein GY874_20730 [Desulfobacteraceae bacterium]|nr:hypothetical protein [Desulfobacteraceae bacterium]
MDIKKRLKAMLQEAEIYRSQGLIAEAKSIYKEASEHINSIEKLKNKNSLLNLINSKIVALDETKTRVEKGPAASRELGKKAQDLIKNLFAFSENKDADYAALEGAVALAKFGQFDRAFDELNALIEKDNVRVEAGKNILRCHLAAATSDEAIEQYKKWFLMDIFLPSQLETLRSYLADILQKKGVKASLPSPLTDGERMTSANHETVVSVEPELEEEFLDITSIGITFDSGPQKGRMIEFDVNFQSGNMLSLIISKSDQELIEGLKSGSSLQDIQFYSPIAIFNGAGMVASKTKIKSGPKQGDYCLDIKIVST